MLEVAEIIRLPGAAYRAHVGDRLLPSQARVLRDLAACRTASFGGQLTPCTPCGRQVYRCPSCRHRHCSTCHGDQPERWLDQQRARLVPCPDSLVTFTLPRTRRTVAFAHQTAVYGVLMRRAAAALQRLAADPRYVRARLGCLAVLHTWTRAMLYHPHVHLLVTAGGLSADRAQWIAPQHPACLVPVQALSILFRAKVGAGLRRAGLRDPVPPPVWAQPWVGHAQPAGDGARGLDDLARDLFRVAISHSRLAHLDDDQVTFRYRDTRTQEIRRATLSGVEFLRRFLQHVLPRRCTKVRDYGLWSATRRADLDHARTLLETERVRAVPARPPAPPPPRPAHRPLRCLCVRCVTSGR